MKLDPPWPPTSKPGDKWGAYRLEAAVNVGMLELMSIASTPETRGDASVRMARLLSPNDRTERPEAPHV